MSSLSLQEQILRASKEIVVKFIETGRISPTTFEENFKNIYQSIKDAVEEKEKMPQASEKSE